MSSANEAAQFFKIPNIVLPANYSICLWYKPTPYSTPNGYENLMGFSLPSPNNFKYGFFTQ